MGLAEAGGGVTLWGRVDVAVDVRHVKFCTSPPNTKLLSRPGNICPDVPKVKPLRGVGSLSDRKQNPFYQGHGRTAYRIQVSAVLELILACWNAELRTA